MSVSPQKPAPSLWRQFLPLSLSDVTMALCDPLVTAAVARLPQPVLTLGALGVAKALAVFFESPIIMLLHASNSLAAARSSRRSLLRFTLLAGGLLAGMITLLTVPRVFGWIASGLLGVEPALIEPARRVLLCLIPWPAVIAWRRYLQGLLIYGGRSADVGRAGIIRVFAVAALLAIGLRLEIAGVWLAGIALISSVLIEAVVVSLAAWKQRAALRPRADSDTGLPGDLRAVWRFYWPLANSMLVVWGGRACLLGVIARAVDGPLALAAWPAAWSLVLVIANSTRMVQQVAIRNGDLPEGAVLRFSAAVGVAASASLLAIGATGVGHALLRVFVGGDAALLAGVRPVLLLSVATPLLVAIKNGCQGLLIRTGRTHRVHAGTWVEAAVLLTSAGVGAYVGIPGAKAAALAMPLSLCAETCFLRLRSTPSEAGKAFQLASSSSRADRNILLKSA